MAHLRTRLGRDGKTRTYQVRFVDPDGRERSRTFKRKALAEDFQTATAHHVRAGTYVDPRAGRVTVKAYLEAWRAQQAHHRRKTADSTATRFRTMVYPRIGEMPIGNVKGSTIRTWQARLLADGYAPRTVKGCRGQLAGAFKDAVRDRLINANPFEGVKAPEVIDERVSPPTLAEVRAGQAACPARYRAMIPFVAGTGLRPSEAWGLTRDRLDFVKLEVRVDRQLAGRVGREPVFGPPKTRAGDRTVPMPESVAKVMRQHLQDYPAEPGQLVFRTSQGTPLTRTVWGRAWRPVAEAMGLREGKGLHQLRHFYASALIAAGRSPKEVQERLGHASIDETMNTYAHLFEAADEGTRAAIDDLFQTGTPTP